MSHLLAGELSGKCLDQESSAVISKFKARISCINVFRDCEKKEVAYSQRKWIPGCVSLGATFCSDPSLWPTTYTRSVSSVPFLTWQTETSEGLNENNLSFLKLLWQLFCHSEKNSNQWERLRFLNLLQDTVNGIFSREHWRVESLRSKILRGAESSGIDFWIDSKDFWLASLIW